MEEQKRLDLFCEVKEVSEDGTFHGIASVYGVEDLGGDVIDKGAFKKTLAENPVVPILWQHKSESVIGEGVVKEYQGKILIDAKLDMDDDEAVKAHKKLKRGLIKGLSIGFQTVKSTWEDVEGRMVRHIGELKLWEVSVVTFPMLPDAQVTRVKSDDRVSALESQVQALHARLTAMSTTPDEGAGKSGDGAASQTTEPGEAHSTVTLNIPASLLA
jgi:HK97 family phage prohead protease